MQASKDPDQKQLAERAIAGDPHAYASIVGQKFQITDTNGKKRTVLPYNSDPGYARRVEAQISVVQSDFAEKKP